jgi:Holliday junction resolvase RusA-like endonuclease
MPGFPKLLPSEAYEQWEKFALQQSFEIKAKLRAAGVDLPIVAMLSVECHIYRQTAVGDTAGYIQAIGDFLQKAGIIQNDQQLEDWDGTRRLKDAANPRVEIFLTVVQDKAFQENLFEGKS